MSVHSLARNWWLITLRGLAAILCSLAVIAWPTLTLPALLLLFAAYLLTDGALATVVGFSHSRELQSWWLLLIEGPVGILTGVLIIVSTGLSAATSLSLIAAWAVLIGMEKIVSAIRLRADIHNEIFLALSGVLSAGLGIVLVIWHDPNIISFVWIIGSYALTTGLLLSGLGFRLWNWQSLKQRALRPV